ncbi:hypothetical protein [Bradymonas sediminis]|uniref:Uncharacterized protein n=1 Tax=Bradymonas sediminis TaxID=1548548 RepID=A0A2Z4FJC7_9DELT|nr:hypothetical protein [Bradymonas sediminis]AWV89033.1 hypothetical protein DN745_06645 [Bradymonas sediminis]TDP64508.1 hypothetical protein DFR33_109172 [Bradymonas sediminis]
MSIKSGSAGSLALLSFIGISLIALTVSASTAGWGVDKPVVDDGGAENSTSTRRTYYGGYYMIFYRSPGIRNVGSRRPGGGFHGGK